MLSPIFPFPLVTCRQHSVQSECHDRSLPRVSCRNLWGGRPLKIMDRRSESNHRPRVCVGVRDSMPYPSHREHQFPSPRHRGRIRPHRRTAGTPASIRLVCSHDVQARHHTRPFSRRSAGLYPARNADFGPPMKIELWDFTVIGL